MRFRVEIFDQIGHHQISAFLFLIILFSLKVFEHLKRSEIEVQTPKLKTAILSVGRLQNLKFKWYKVHTVNTVR